MNMVSTVRLRLDDDKRGGLLSCTYTNPELFEIEKHELFRKTWQIACHVSDVPNIGGYYSFDLVGERALIVRGKDLPEKQRKVWYYYGLFPNMVLMLYPDLVGFYQEFPAGIDKTIQRFYYYALADERAKRKSCAILPSALIN